MKWFRFIAAFLLLIFSLPIWRLLDWAVIVFAKEALSTALMIFWGLLFILLPLKLIMPKLNWKPGLSFLIILGSLSWISGPLTTSTTLDPELTHCGRTTYAGFLHPIKSSLSSSYQDDLDARNQLCWVRKMIRRTPETLSKEELQLKLDHLKVILLRPEIKFRITLPAVLVLVGNYISAGIDENTALERALSSKVFIDSLVFWTQQYTEEISQRTYAWYEWPHSDLIQAEYGFLERNWQNLHLKFNQ